MSHPILHPAVPPAPFDLTPYLSGRGLPEPHHKQIQKQIDESIIAGIDREHNIQMIAHCPATSDYLYTQYTPKPVYQRGSRPMLERIVDSITSRYVGEANQVHAIVNWVISNVDHPVNRPCKSPADTAPTEERIIEHGWGWCNEQGRLVVALAQIAGFPARMCLIFHKNAPASHATTEVFFNNKWVWVDPTWGFFVCADPSHPFSAKELQTDPYAQRVCDDQYARAKIAYEMRWARERIPDKATQPPSIGVERLSESFHSFGLCNYLI